MTIILSGGGDAQDVVPIDLHFASILDKGKPVLYVPAALAPDDGTFEACYDWFSSTYAAYGIQNIEMCRDLSMLVLDDRYSAVFVGGGNTFRLLNYVRQSDFQRQLKAYLDAGGIYYGGSAGAILCGRSIEPASNLDENAVGLTDLTGLDLLGGFDVWCHYGHADEAAVGAYPHDLYVLYEESGLVYDGRQVTALGKPFMTKSATE